MGFRGVLSRFGRYFGIAYIPFATAACLWIVSFAPAEGPVLGAFIPKNAGLILHVRNGAELGRAIATNKAFKELFDDPDFREANSGLFEQRELALKKWQSLPAIAQQLIPPTLSGLYPFAGRECAVVLCDSEGAARTPVLILTRVSGLQGQLARMGIRFAKLPKNAELFDLGGDLVGIGLDGARPERGSQPTLAPVVGAVKTGKPPLAQLTLFPRHIPKRRATAHAIKTSIQLQKTPQEPLLQRDGLRDELTDEGIDVTKPTSLAEVFGLKDLPESVRMEIYENAEGGLNATGSFEGTLPPLPPITKGDPAIFAEGLLPLDVRAAFHLYMEGVVKSPRRRRRWLACLDYIREQGIDLGQDVWPAIGNVIHFGFQETPENFGSVEYGLLNAQIAFDGKNDKAREAIGELARGRWEILDGKGDNSISGQYLRRVRTEKADRYILVTKEIMAPTWTVGEHEISLVSDAGPFALLDKSLDGPPLGTAKENAVLETPRRASFFLRLDGPRMASKMETWATKYYNDVEEDMGSTKEFLAKYPDAAVQIRLAKKYSGLLGKFSLEMVPAAKSGHADIEMHWTPGTLAVHEERNNDSAPPPPPPTE